MKKFIMTLPLGLLLLTILAVSCKKEETSSVGFSMKAVDALTTVQPPDQPFHLSGDENALPLSWNVAWIYVIKLEFKAEYTSMSSLKDTNNSQYYYFSWQGNQQIDLLGKPVMFADIELPPGYYNHIDLRLTSARISSFIVPNFFLSGIYGLAKDGTPISVTVTQPFEMNIKYDGFINTENSNFFGGLIELSLNQVFNGISAAELDNAEITDGWILISASHNVDLYNKILANLQAKPESSLTWGVQIKQ